MIIIVYHNWAYQPWNALGLLRSEWSERALNCICTEFRAQAHVSLPKRKSTQLREGHCLLQLCRLCYF